MASWPSFGSSGQLIPLACLRRTAWAISLPLWGRVGWGMTGSWRRHHEPSALVCTTRGCGPSPSSPFLGSEPAGITRAVDRRARDQRPHDGPGRLQRGFADVAGAPFDADPRRGESRCGNPIRIVNAGGVAYYRAEAHPDAARCADAHSYGVSEAHPYAVADAETYIAPDTHDDGHPDP